MTVAVVVFLAMTLSGTNANPEEDETAGEHILQALFMDTYNSSLGEFMKN